MTEPTRERMCFDDWARLASRNPAAFEAQRARALEAAISRANSAERRQRLRRLQWRVDMMRARANTPLAACVQMYEMMWNTVLHGQAGNRAGLPRSRRADVLRFPRSTRPAGPR